MIIDPWHRIDVDELSKNFATMSTFDIAAHCEGTFDVFFKSKRFYCNGHNQKQFEYFLQYLNMHFEEENILHKINKMCMLEKAIPGRAGKLLL